jgi:hypothetical protein
VESPEACLSHESAANIAVQDAIAAQQLAEKLNRGMSCNNGTALAAHALAQRVSRAIRCTN